MKRRILVLTLTLSGAIVGTTASHPARGNASLVQPTRKGAVMTARGTFEVRLSPQPADSEGGPFGRLLLDKTFQGDLTAASKGQMLGAETAVAGSAGYVALEQVTGTLNGRRGSFILQHLGHMSRGAMTMTITVVPDSGTDELTGLAGRFNITITGGKHYYEFEYTLGH